MSRPSGVTYAGGSPYRAVPLGRFTPRGCETGAHHAVRVTEDDGTWLWACLNCPAIREQGQPGWRTT